MDLPPQVITRFASIVKYGPQEHEYYEKIFSVNKGANNLMPSNVSCPLTPRTPEPFL